MTILQYNQVGTHEDKQHEDIAKSIYNANRSFRVLEIEMIDSDFKLLFLQCSKDK